jgi:ABC-type nitrate/sulfonate/bicarbonate transport system ATPase subunit
MTIGENVLSGLKLAQIKVENKDELLESCLVRAGLWNEVKDRLGAHGGSLSGGQQQRLCIARALAVSPQVLLMDEPFGALDAQTRAILQVVLIQIWEQEKKSVIYVTHSFDEAVFLSDRVVVMTARPGQIKSTYTIDLPRPRDTSIRSSAIFHRLSDAIRADLFEEVDKSRLMEWGALNANKA